MSRHRCQKLQKGYIAFTSILVISVVALTISMSISLLGVGEAKSSSDFKKGQEALKIAEGCVEEALIRLRNDSTFSSASLNVGNGSCSISISGTGGNRIIDVLGQTLGHPSFRKRIQVSVRKSGNSINVLSWREI